MKFIITYREKQKLAYSLERGGRVIDVYNNIYDAYIKAKNETKALEKFSEKWGEQFQGCEPAPSFQVLRIQRIKSLKKYERDYHCEIIKFS